MPLTGPTASRDYRLVLIHQSRKPKNQVGIVLNPSLMFSEKFHWLYVWRNFAKQARQQRETGTLPAEKCVTCDLKILHKLWMQWISNRNNALFLSSSAWLKICIGKKIEVHSYLTEHIFTAICRSGSQRIQIRTRQHHPQIAKMDAEDRGQPLLLFWWVIIY